MTNSPLKRSKVKRGYQLVPIEPTRGMLMALAGEPVILAASDEEELRKRYAHMLKMSPVR